MLFYSFGAVGRRGNVAVFETGLTSVLVEQGGPFAILLRKRWQKLSYNCEASSLRLKDQEGSHYFMIHISSPFLLTALLFVRGDSFRCEMYILPCCWKSVKPSCFTCHIWKIIRFFLLLANNMKTVWIFSFIWADLQPFLTGRPLANVATLKWHFHLFHLYQVKY